MIPKLTFKTAPNQKIWFVSDLHLGHAKEFILDPRDYTNVDEAMAHTWLMLQETIKPEDIVFHLGDAVVGAGLNGDAYTKRLIFLPCKRQYYIWGNHNAGMKDAYQFALNHYGYRSDVEVYPLDFPDSNFTFLGHRAEIFIDGIPVVLDHYPIASWNHLSKGGYNIHGHCHRNLKEDLTLLRLDVGWDWLKRPAEWHEICQEMKKHKPVAPDHHGKEDI
jgi:calcineurin-like phosphoesterase family protein